MLDNKPKLYIPRLVFQQIMHWVNRATGEVGGMGIVHYNKQHNYFYVDQVFLLEQEVTGGTTELNDIALSKLEYHCAKNKIAGDLSFWWHSHCDFGVFWSGQDTDTIKMLGRQGLCVATVFNKKQQMKSAVCSTLKTQYGQKSFQLTDDLETVIYDAEPDKDLVKQWSRDFDQRVKEKKYKAPTLLPTQEEVETTRTTSTSLATGAGNGGVTPNSRNWGVPTAEKVATCFAEWRRMCPDEPFLTKADKDIIIAAAATTFNMVYFNYIEENITLEQWGELDNYIAKFNENNHNFDWSTH